MRNYIKRRFGSNPAFAKLLLWYRVLCKLPDYYLAEQAEMFRGKLPWVGNRVAVSDRTGLFVPVYAPTRDPDGNIHRTYDIFNYHAASHLHRLEVQYFMEFASTARCLLDLGAAEGFFSALFAGMHGADGQIVSVDCGAEAQCIHEHLYLTRDTNIRHSGCTDWRIVKAFVSNSVTQQTESLDDLGFTLPEDCPLTTLPTLCEGLGFRPDLIKLDVESSEYEILFDSIEFLKSCRPRLCIELHNDMLERRGLTGVTIIKRLASIGYRIIHTDTPRWEQAANCHVFLHNDAHPL
ncbi:MAG: FkbM family methyltransferase [Proteobacteria bacterium]|nr:FkbM family methyltransferase [Pseudomonadota bacterium]